MGTKRDRDADRIADLCGAVRELSAELAALAQRLPADEHSAVLGPIVGTDRAMLRALGHSADAGQPFAEVRRYLVDVLQMQPARGRLPWHGGPMSVPWALQNRLAVTWTALDQLAEAAGEARPAPLQPIVELALDLLPHSFLRAGQGAPEATVAIALDVPGAPPWQLASRQPADWPPPHNRVTGPAIDLCRLACGRTTRSATSLVAEGNIADLWLDVIDALAYSNPPD